MKTPHVGMLRFCQTDGGLHLLEAIWVNRLDEPAVGAIVINARDATDRHRLEDQLRQADHAVVHRDLNAGSAFLQKPFTPEAFARTVRGILDRQ